MKLAKCLPLLTCPFPTAFLLLTASPGAAANADEVAVLVTLIEEADVPALQPGQLAELAIVEGQSVVAGELLGKLSDKSATLDVTQAEIELVNARQQAENDVQVRLRRQAADVAATELRRAEESRHRHPKSVSATEMDLLRLTASQSVLEIEAAEHDLATARRATDLRENELRLAQHQLSERQIRAPIDGLVVRVNQKKGEWVQPGDVVARIVRLDRLRAEGYLHSDQIQAWMPETRVTLTVNAGGKDEMFVGTLGFVSPEVNPVNGQVRFWAEIDNAHHRLRPGISAKLVIHRASGTGEAE